MSESAVSRALHDHPRISLATRERIKKIAADLEFEFNSHARSLSTRKSGTIGLILPNFGGEARRSYYLDLLVNDVRSELAASGYDLLVAESTEGGSSQTSLRRLVLQNKVDALVLIIGELHELDRVVLQRRQVPVVLVNSKPLPLAGQSLEEFPSFYTDNRAGGALAAEHLIARGCRALVCLADEVAGPEMVDRTEGFVAEAERAGLAVQVFERASDFASSEEFVKANLERFRGIDGVFCHTDVMACAVLKALTEGGIRVPQAVKVIGYDDIELGTYFSPRLTTIHQPREAIARSAVAHLMTLVSAGCADAAAHVSLSPSLVVREST